MSDIPEEENTLTPEQQDAHNAALEHAWAWFSLHATQRLQAVNFFLVATAFLMAAFVTAAKEQIFSLSAAVGVLAICISIYFYRMERRVQSLIHASENAIGPLQELLAKQVQIDSIRIVSHVENPRPGEWKYSKVFRHLYFSTGCAFGLGLMYSAWAAYKAPSIASAANLAPFKFVIHGILGVFLLFIGYEMIIGVPQKNELNSRRNCIKHWSLLLLGIVSATSGIGVILHLIFKVL
ncbi:hypothetical protein [Gimesia fumaroli]|uniref:Uncharacterized protein n=1 Tax=Gimesia fumaroli TaxID=2527976 RepID=A0A518IK92_9PLAN|nr:hypothetical protein [Gimesia fumaroli]QDV53512.1 hypothetical protein Enr17x_55870 [Gimesia fumaroli]